MIFFPFWQYLFCDGNPLTLLMHLEAAFKILSFTLYWSLLCFISDGNWYSMSCLRINLLWFDYFGDSLLARWGIGRFWILNNYFFYPFDGFFIVILLFWYTLLWNRFWWYCYLLYLSFLFTINLNFFRGLLVGRGRTFLDFLSFQDLRNFDIIFLFFSQYRFFNHLFWKHRKWTITITITTLDERGFFNN